MATLFDKLNWKDAAPILVVNAPESFEAELAKLRHATISRDLKQVKESPFSLAFVTRKSEVDTLAPRLAKRAKGDAILWFAYPKGTSKKFKCDFKRDTGWDALQAECFETVRSVSIDDDWTALRFRRQEFVKSRS